VSVVDVTIPALGVAMTEAGIVRWHVEVGQSVDEGQPLAEIETDKVVMDLESPAAGVVTEILGEAGSSVDVGEPIARLETSGAGSPSAPTAPAAPSATPEPMPEPPPVPVPVPVSAPVPVPTPASAAERQPHGIPPRARFAERTGVAVNRHAHDLVAVSGDRWSLTQEVSAEGAVARLAEARQAGSAIVTLTDVLLTAVARTVAEVAPGLGADLRLAVDIAEHMALVALAPLDAANLPEVATIRRAAVESAWASAGEPLAAGATSLVVVNAGAQGADICLPPAFGDDCVTIGFGAARPRIWRVGEGVGVRTTVTISVSAPAAFRPATLRNMLSTLADKVAHR
jgi:pyruvate/2-oxoglutarate dehydrogenase complex dihydrolipoamide acyltransferase (E2) component